jgi:hypothetical protein
MSKIQGESSKMVQSILKIIDGKLCSSLPKIFKPDDRQAKLNNTVFSAVGSGGDDDDTIVLKNLTETLMSVFLDLVKKSLIDNREELVDLVTNTIIDDSKLVDEKVRQAK